MFYFDINLRHTGLLTATLPTSVSAPVITFLLNICMQLLSRQATNKKRPLGVIMKLRG
mgnify:FL=1